MRYLVLLWLVYTPLLVLVFHAICNWLVRYLGVIEHYSIPKKWVLRVIQTKPMAGLNSRLKGDYEWFPSSVGYTMITCVYTHTIVLVLCRRALLSSASGKKYWQLIIQNSNAKSRWERLSEERSLKDEFGGTLQVFDVHRSVTTHLSFTDSSKTKKQDENPPKN